MLITADELRSLATDIFTKAGCSDEEAERIARRLVSANLTGHDSHGVTRVQRYVQWLRAGVQVAGQDAEIITQTESWAVMDGHFGMGQTVGEQAVQVGIDMALENSVAIVALKHAGHLGRIGDWAEMAAASNLVSIHFVNVRGGALVAPFGGSQKRFGTNPVTVGIPRRGDDPLVLDFATSVVAEGKANVALQGGPSLPEGSLITGDGQLTNDPTALYGETEPGALANPRNGKGGLRAMGEHKGSGLAFMCELLGGALTGSGATGPENRRFCNGMLSIYVAPGTFDSEDTFVAEVTDFVGWMKETRTAEGHDEVLVPGEPEQRRRADRTANGIDLPQGTWDSIVEAARMVGLDDGRTQR